MPEFMLLQKVKQRGSVLPAGTLGDYGISAKKTVDKSVDGVSSTINAES